jgi:poly(3-hydroxybutyrate) depolymerase
MAPVGRRSPIDSASRSFIRSSSPPNNPRNCFSWFLPGDIARGHGEALSIREMVEHAIATFAVDRGKVFVTGLSAGGAMASVMLATYPSWLNSYRVVLLPAAQSVARWCATIGDKTR